MKRGAPLKRSTPMLQGKPLARTGMDISGAPLGRNLRGAERAPIAARRASRRETGFSPAARLAIRTRAGNGDPSQARCEATGVFLGLHGGEFQHRVARQMGGSRLRNNVANGVLLSREAHRLAESRDERSHAQGFWLLSSEDPLAVAIMLHGRDGGVVVWLDNEGHYLDVAGNILGGGS